MANRQNNSYRVPAPNFVEDFMYTPPWDLALIAMEVNEEGIKNTLNSADILQNITLDYLQNDPVEREMFEESKKKYEDEASSIATNIQLEMGKNPTAWRRYIPQLTNLSSELQEDLKYGNLSKIAQSYSNYKKWEEDNKEIKEKDPLSYAYAERKYMEEWRKNPRRSLDNTWKGDDLVYFDVDNKEIMEGLKNFKAKIETEAKNGYLIKREYLPAEKVAQIYMDRVLADPLAKAYVQQSIKLGIPGFVDENNQPLDFYVYKDNKEKKYISRDEYLTKKSLYNSMTPEERAKKGLYENTYDIEFNPNHTWSRVFMSYGRQLEQDNITMQGDATWQFKQRLAFDREKFAHQKIMDALNFAKGKPGDDREKKIQEEILKEEFKLARTEKESERKKILGNIDRLKKMLVSNLATTENFQMNYVLSLDEIQKIKNGDTKDGTIEKTMLALDKNITESIIQKMGDKVDKDFLLYLDKNAIDTKSNLFNKIFSSVGIDTDVYRRTVKDYLVSKGIPEKDLKISLPSTGALPSLKVDSPLYQQYLDLGEKFFDKKRQAYKEFSERTSPVEVAPVTPEGGYKIYQRIIKNPEGYTAIPMDPEEPSDKEKGSVKDKKSRLYDAGKVILDSKIEGVATTSFYGVGTVIKDKNGRNFLIVNNNFVNDSWNDNYTLYNDPKIYARDEDAEKINSTFVNEHFDKTKNILYEATKSGMTKKDPVNKDSKGRPLEYVKIEEPLINGKSIEVRHYPEQGIYSIYYISKDKGDINPKSEFVYQTSPIRKGETQEEYYKRISNEFDNVYDMLLLGAYNDESKEDEDIVLK